MNGMSMAFGFAAGVALAGLLAGVRLRGFMKKIEQDFEDRRQALEDIQRRLAVIYGNFGAMSKREQIKTLHALKREDPEAFAAVAGEEA